jgi:protoporphyrinogen oxidase
MMKIAIIGGGITGVSLARMLSDRAEVVVFEQAEKIGGLIRCDRLPGGLYHKLGGHVFNTKTPAVSDWFWSFFDRDSEFLSIKRDAKILIGDKLIGYPIENHLYQFDGDLLGRVLEDIISCPSVPLPSANFADFLLNTFGKTLCETYFYPYNEKLWRGDLRAIPMSWLEGKLPMPTTKDILLSNIRRSEEAGMVHSSFFYPKNNGSQFIVDRIAEGVDVRLSNRVTEVQRNSSAKWTLSGSSDEFDLIVYTGDLRNLDFLLPSVALSPAWSALSSLKTRGITNVFCECDATSTSWLYLPEKKYSANRIIYTGAFSPNNNNGSRMTCVVEFNYGEGDSSIERDLASLPGNLKPLSINHVKDAYVIQDHYTRENVARVAAWGSERSFLLAGRFAEWEYYNMDKCIEKALLISRQIGIKYV